MLKLAILVASIAFVQYAAAVCNVCNDNGVACVGEKEFQLCQNRQPDTSRNFTCPGENTICTKLAAVCANKTENTTIPGCGDTSNCGRCDGAASDGTFSCTSRTTFTMCFDGALSDIRDTCAPNQICDISLGKEGKHPCVPNCREAEIEFCDLYEAIDEPVVTTLLPPTITTMLPTTMEELPSTTTTTTTRTPPVTQTTATTSTTTTSENPITVEVTATTPTIATTAQPTSQTTPQPTRETTTEEAATTTMTPPRPSVLTTTNVTTTVDLPTSPTRPSTTSTSTTTQNPAELVCSQQTAAGRHPYPNDTTCNNYIYCFKKGGAMQTTLLKCPGTTFFNPVTTLCGPEKPAGCA